MSNKAEILEELSPKVTELLNGMVDLLEKQDPHPAVVFTVLVNLFVLAVKATEMDIEEAQDTFNNHVRFVLATGKMH